MRKSRQLGRSGPGIIVSCSGANSLQLFGCLDFHVNGRLGFAGQLLTSREVNPAHSPTQLLMLAILAAVPPVGYYTGKRPDRYQVCSPYHTIRLYHV